jgi:hypothetical protein
MSIFQGFDATMKTCKDLHCNMADIVDKMCYSKVSSVEAQW